MGHKPVPGSFRVLFLRSSLLLGAAVLVSSCLTPEFIFDPDPSASDDGGGEGPSGDGDGEGPPSCENRSLDGDETDTDCGGLDCPPCELSSRCEKTSDCAGADVVCADERCQPESCTDGVKSGDESDTDCGGESCARCGTSDRCKSDGDCESRVCDSGTCAEPTCTDQVENGTETDLDCGGMCDPCSPGDKCLKKRDCVQPPASDPATTSCLDERCALICPPGFGDCNQEESDGCETNLNTNAGHCGACASVCDPPHATAAKCQGGECLIDFETGGCAGTWRDCNGMPEDGCETNTSDEVEHCGDCNKPCSEQNGAASCSAGTCGIDCDGTFENCDQDARSNGCEVDTDASILHCGMCENACTAEDGEVASCDTNQAEPCVSIACEVDDCGGQTPCGACGADGVCNDVLNTISNCGGCGIECSASNATVVCAPSAGGTCEVNLCLDSGGKDYEDCDGLYENGCEVDVRTDMNECGGCVPGEGVNCQAVLDDGPLHVSGIGCQVGSCVISGCDGAWADCDGNPTNGCEVNTQTNGTRCGGCLASDPKSGSGVDCSTQASSTGACVNSACEVDECNLPKLTRTGCAPRAITRTVDGSTSISGEFSATWNATALTVVVTLFDTTAFNDSAEHWKDDGVELYLDLNNSKGGSFDNVNDYQILFGRDATDAQGAGPGLNTGALTVSQTSVTGGYRLTLTVPWSALNGASAPATSSTIGFDVALNDDSNGGERDGQKVWVGGNQNFNNPSLWGNLKLN